MNTSEIPRDLFPGIIKLYLQYNELITIPKYALDGFEKLQVLDIGNNQLSSLHNESFCGLKSLVNLGLADNNIKSLPRGSFACAEKLKSIDLSCNDISQLFSGTPSLQNLYLQNNKISTIEPFTLIPTRFPNAFTHTLESFLT
eukprot:XP_011660816.1 PREDICTED: leucine-rich glioma-inactivated protein 1-like [Strongylocentrotus purpuratus]